jgi:hypothetical protein
LSRDGSRGDDRGGKQQRFHFVTLSTRLGRRETAKGWNSRQGATTARIAAWQERTMRPVGHGNWLKKHDGLSC